MDGVSQVMGFFRVVGYIFASILLIACLLAIPLGLLAIWIPILMIWALKKSGQVAAMKEDLHYLAEKERIRDDVNLDIEREKENNKRLREYW